MATSIHLTQERSLTTGGDDTDKDYKLTTVFSKDDPDPSPGFPVELILARKVVIEGDEENDEDDTYEHVCTVGDINRYTASRPDETLYYRVASWTLFFDSLEELSAEALVQREKTQFLVTDWENYTGGDIEETLFDDDITSS